jgi:hypothetical protein
MTGTSVLVSTVGNASGRGRRAYIPLLKSSILFPTIGDKR